MKGEFEMATPTTSAREEVLTLTREQIMAILEREARKRLGLSARELFRRYAKGLLDDPGEVSDLVVIADLLPEDDELFAAI
jgi:hypothetical protein